MALRWIDGFESYSGLVSLIPFRYTVGTLNSSLFETGRALGNALGFNGSSMATPDLGNQATYVVGFGFQNVNMSGSTAVTVLQFNDSTTTQIDIRFNPSTKVFSCQRGSTVLGTGTKVINTGVWYYVEVKATIDPSVGVVNLKVNEVTDINLTGQNTRQSSNNYANIITFTGTSGGGRYRIDDLYILDTTGGSNNDFLGDMKVEGIAPNSEGGNTNWTATPTSTPNYQCVETYGDSEYISTGTPTTIDTFNFGNLYNITGDIAAVQVVIWAKNTDSTNHTIKSAIRIGSSNYLAATAQTVDDTAYKAFNFIHETNPATTSVWSTSGVNGAEFGVDLVS